MKAAGRYCFVQNAGQRGSIDFDFPETKVILDKQGHPVEIKPYDRNPATKIIEDFMLAANETVAQDYFWQELPFVYRTHEVPDTEKIKKLSTFINNFGYNIHIGSDEVHPKELQKLLTKIEDTPEEALICAADTAFHEAGKIQRGVCGAFRTGGPVLLPFYITDPSLSGSADPSDHQGQPAGKNE